MIGGTDIVIANPGRRTPEALDAIIRTVQGYWPELVLQDGATGTRFPSYAAVEFSTLREVFLYRDNDAFESWEALEADASNADTMLHVLVDDEHVTLVVDDADNDFVMRVRRAIIDMLHVGMSWEAAA